MSARIDMVGIFVNDLHKMVSFYRDLLGFEIVWDGQGPYAEFKNEGVRFSMYERAQLPGLLGQTPGYPAGLNGTFELALDFATSADVDREFARVVRAGGKCIYEPRDEPWGMHSAMIADPEGNLIEIGSWNKGNASKIIGDNIHRILKKIFTSR
jgi:catechol 2,3-dioxygenase-like lactoylglutathione lyase family enzyme